MLAGVTVFLPTLNQRVVGSSPTAGGGIDFDWLLDCLEVGHITIRVGEEADFAEVDGLYLNHKGLRAAEEYLLARYHLYGQVYMHKTTRGAEKLLGALLPRVASIVEEGNIAVTGLAETHPLVRYYAQVPTVATYCDLDDAIVASAVEQMQYAEDVLIAELAKKPRRQLTEVQVLGGCRLRKAREGKERNSCTTQEGPHQDAPLFHRSPKTP